MVANWTAQLNYLAAGTKGKARLHHEPMNAGYQGGAMLAMHTLLSKGWQRDYDWVIRLNPDVLVYDDSYLDSFFRSPYLNTVLANCHGGTLQNQGTVAVMSDFFAFRPEHIPSNAFANWQEEHSAEEQVTRVFNDSISFKTCAWLLPHQNSFTCRTRGNGVWHWHYDMNIDASHASRFCKQGGPCKESTCVETLQAKRWHQDPIAALPTVPEHANVPFVHSS